MRGRTIESNVQRGTFDCCKNCADRRIGCHGICKDYVDAKAKHQDNKRKQYMETQRPQSYLKRFSEI